MNLLDGAVVASRFRLNRMLGRGGMGSVWHATHLGLDIPCAVKFIEGEFAALPEAQARFEREAKAAAQLRSPHVVQILDHGISDGCPYIAMELLDGEDLGKRLTRTGALSPAETSLVVTQVCRALTKAHSLGIVHRDLKPDNIFLVRDDDREIAKVLDFGIAKSSTSGIDGSNTKTGAMLGTPYYMSPEQAQGTKAVDYRSDLWSLAVIVFQCVTGRLPFESEALGDLLVKIIVNEMPVPSHYGRVPPGFDDWWRKAASRQPDQRFQSAKEFAESLQAVFQQAGVGGVMPNTPYPNTPYPDPRSSDPNLLGAPAAMAQSVANGGAPGGPVNMNTTGAPIARTFGGAMEGTAQPKKGPPVGAIVGGGAALVLVVVLGLVGVKVLAKDDTKAAASGVPQPSASVAAPEPPKPVESAKPTETAAKPVESAAEKPAEKTAAADPKKDEAKTKDESRSSRRTSTKTSTTGTAASAKPAAKSALETMGF